MKRHRLRVAALLPVLFSITLTLTPALAHRQPRQERTSSSILAQLAVAQRDQQDLAAARLQPSNLIDLTRRLKLHLPTPISPYVRATAPNYQVGHVDTFWVAQATSGYYAVKGTLLLKTAHTFWYVQQGIGIPMNKLMAGLRASARDFETHIYPTDRAAFGAEEAVGPDRDPRITILNANLPGPVAGYYTAEDLFPRSVNPYSNQRKMLYMTITDYPLGSPGFAEIIAHEYQHMIHRARHQLDDAWINEGSSVLAQVLNGYTSSGFEQDFAAAPGTQADTFCAGPPECSGEAGFASYGAAFQWMLYFYQHYGGDRALRAMLDDNTLDGMALFDDVLARLGYHDTARDMFRKWAIANFVDDPSIAGGIYGYRPIYQGCCMRNVSLAATAHSYPFVRHGQVHSFATDYVQLNPSGSSTLRLSFSGDPTVRVVPNTPVQGSTEWWSNRGDESDTTLTRAVDLSRVRHATLQYDVWYSTEPDYDYGYVEVSDDNGRTWHTLRARGSTNGDPNGANFGNGYTGLSSKVAGNHNGWLHESLDLSRYAGRHIMIRFEQITDDEINLPGITLDNIRIPEIGYADTPGDAGWQRHGWVRISNLLPTRWAMQLILYTSHGVQVRQLPVSALGRGTATITGLGHDVRRVVLAISPLASQTTVPSNYTLKVQ